MMTITEAARVMSDLDADIEMCNKCIYEELKISLAAQERMRECIIRREKLEDCARTILEMSK